MLEAFLWGAFTGSALLVGAAIALRWHVTRAQVGWLLGFGVGVLISAVAFDLVLEAYTRTGGETWTVGLGLAAGALSYFGGNRALDRRGPGTLPGSEDASRLVLGGLLDGIPESFALGFALIESGAPGAAFVAAVFMSNLPEGMSWTARLREAGRPTRLIVRLWLLITVVSAFAALLGYALLDGAPAEVASVIEAYAAGAILQTIATTMLPEAMRNAGDVVGLFTVLGFALSFVLSVLA
jgi:ZIP family zinc transporter